MGSFEIRNGVYRPWHFIFAHTSIALVMVFLLSSCCVLAAYTMGNLYLDPSNIAMNLLTFYAIHLAMEFYAHFNSAVWNSALLSLMEFVNYWFASFLFMGLFLNLDEVMWPLKGVTYLMPFRWGFSSFVYTELAWTHRELDGARLCQEGEKMTTENGCLFLEAKLTGQLVNGMTQLEGIGEGFSCGPRGTYEHSCVGATGNQALSSMNRMGFSLVKDENNVWMNTFILLTMAFLHKAGHFFLFHKRALRSPPLPENLPPGVVVAASASAVSDSAAP